jgi:hypothetical protein
MRGQNGNFIPGRLLKGFELITILVRSVSGYLPEPQDGKTTWYANYVTKAKELGILTPTDTIDVTQNVSRKTMAEWLLRVSKLPIATK